MTLGKRARRDPYFILLSSKCFSLNNNSSLASITLLVAAENR